ncbi:DUF4440 domain-containing protein [Chromobacterium sinusclupearum]|uniref:DUF4440 domain-containing protein n=1 Tax=Chromobacterium sinusclupearum TaxID=2077146 RepID=A0A2K4MR11_9NEIS|nr:SgcJ/EcaC family oxidoreductase [Chromobacterium sinusclupearum]POA99439.1 DUF4440 domain-containing protein [Chromobacterium sinusclupearum]
MQDHPVAQLIAAADVAINAQDFDRLMDFYADDAVLVIRPGLNACGKEQIRQAFIAIAAHFNHSLQVSQDAVHILHSCASALALAKTRLKADELDEITRDATYVFAQDTDGAWRCTIDNSYGHQLLEPQQ